MVHLARIGQRGWLGLRLVGVILVAFLAVVGIGYLRGPDVSYVSSPAPSWMDPNDPGSVLKAYRDGAIAGQCAVRVPRTTTFTSGNGDLCGATRITAYEIVSVTAGPTGASASARITQHGSGDGSIPWGTITWFYGFERTDEGYALARGGSGP